MTRSAKLGLGFAISLCLAFAPCSIQRRADQLCRALAAIRHGGEVDLRISQNITQTLRDILGHFPRTQHSFEFVRGHQNAHRIHSMRGTSSAYRK